MIDCCCLNVNNEFSLRWKDDRAQSEYRGGRNSTKFNNYGGRDYGQRDSYGYASRVNELGFHGDMRPNPRIEDELFFKNESQSAGINFDNVSVVYACSILLKLCIPFDSMIISQLKLVQVVQIPTMTLLQRL